MVVTGISEAHAREAVTPDRTEEPAVAPAASGDLPGPASPGPDSPGPNSSGPDFQDFKLLLDASPAGVFRTGPDGGVVLAGGRLYQRAGMAGPGPWGERFDRFLHPEDRARVQASWEAAVAAQAPQRIEYRVDLADGVERWVLSDVKPQFDPAGRFLGHVGTTTDITEQKRTEAKLRDGEELYRSIIAALGEGIILVGADGAILECNACAERILGASAEELKSRNINQPQRRILREDGTALPPDENPARISLATGQPTDEIVVGIERPDGGVTWIRTRSQPLRHPGEAKPFGVVVSLVDFTEQRESEEDLRRAKDEAEAANRTKSAFLANMSHELRTPLNAIIGFAEIMRDELLGPLGADHYREYAADIHQSGKHLLDLINDILDLSKVEAGRLELHEEDCDVPELLAASLRLMNERAHASDLRIEQRFPVRLPLLRADARSLKQILLNLVSNAIKFTPSGGRIVISAEAGPDAFRLTIADSGIGMTVDGVRKALEAFGQVDSSLSRRYEGTGLGLPLTRALVELHGGRLEIESALGEGTRVTAAFPGARIIRELPPV
jgi:PAS domain S-box-containing protein